MRIAIVLLALAALVGVGVFLSVDGTPGADPAATPHLDRDETPSAEVGERHELPRRARAGASSGGEAPPAATSRGSDGASGAVSGIVRRATDGKHVVGATVTWFLGPSVARDAPRTVVVSDLDRAPDGTTTTDGEGAFAFYVGRDVAWEIHVAEGDRRASAAGIGPWFVDVELDLPIVSDFRVVTGDPRVPVAGAVVSAFADVHSDVPFETIVADSAGRGLVPLGENGWLLATAPGFAPDVRRARQRTEGRLEIVLRPGAAVEGDVVDAAGNPVEGARVLCDFPDVPRDVSVVTGADGRFAFVGPTGEVRKLSVSAEGFADAEIRALPGSPPVRVVLDAAAWVEGRVVDAQGRIVEEFIVLRGEHLGEGRFRVGPLPPGVHDILVEDARVGHGAGSLALVTVRAGERRTGVEIVLPDPDQDSEVLAQVLDPEGRPAEGGMVYCTRGAGRPPSPPVQVTREPTRLRLHDPPGTAVCVLAYFGYDDRPWVAALGVETITARPGKAEPVVLRLRAARSVAVRVLNSFGVEAPELRPRLAVDEVVGARPIGRGLLVADDARFRLRVSIEGRPDHEVDVGPEDIVGGVLTVRLPAGPVLRGRVLLPEGTRVRRMAVLAVVRTGGPEPIRVWTDLSADGSFAVAGLPRGAAHLDVLDVDTHGHRGPIRLERVEFTVTADDLDLGEIRLAPLVRLEGVTVDERDVPVGDVRVLVQAGERFRRHGSSTDGRELPGVFAVEVPEGTPILVFGTRHSLASDPVQVTTAAGGPPLRLVLRRTANVLLRVPPDDDDDPGLWLVAPGGHADIPLVLTYRTGGARSAEIPPGTWDLRAALGSRTWTRRVTVASNDVVEWTLGE